MLLRRLTLHVREQNWTAIGIDLVIVVVGVFIGIQVANWNEGRLAVKRGSLFTERLKQDLNVEAWNYANMMSYHGQVRANAVRAADALSGRAELSDEALLVAAFRATQYSDNSRQRSTFDELTSTGELGLITEPELRKLSNHLYSTPVFQWFIDEGRSSKFRNWFRMRIPHHVQAAVAASCGDKVVNTLDYSGIDGALEYPCRLDLPATDIAQAAATLRTDPDALPALRQRIADLGTSLANLDTFYAAEWAYLRRVSEKAR